MKLKSKNITLLFATFFVLFQFYVYRVWLLTGSLLTHGDWMLSLDEYSKELLSFPMLWRTSSLGGIDATPPFYPFLLLQGILANLNVPYAFIERITFMWPIALGLLPISYLFLRSLIKNKLACLIGALVYTYNSYFIIIQAGHLTLMVAFMLCPLAFYLFRRLLLEEKKILILFCSLVLFAISFYEFRAFYILTLVLFSYYIFSIFFIKKIKVIKDFIYFSILAMLPFLIVLLLNTYWIISVSNIGNFNTNVVLNRNLFGNEFSNILYAITLHHYFWAESKIIVFETQKIPAYFWLIPFFSFLGIYTNRKNRDIVFFGLVSLAGIFLAKQVGTPFSWVYLLMYENIPGFNAFREASKFFFLIALGYSVLTAAGIDWLWKKWNATRRQIIGKYMITFIITAIFLLHTAPIVTGSMGSLFLKREMPDDFAIVNNFIQNNSTFYRTLWVPIDSRWSTQTNTHPRIGAINLINADWNIFIKNKITESTTQGELIKDLFEIKEANNLLDMSSIKYVIVPIEDKINDDNFFVNYFKPRQYYVDALNKTPYLHRVNLGEKEIVVYENTGYKPHVYITHDKETVKNNIPYEEISHEMINPTEYRISSEGVKKPFYLNFSESYHPQWELRVGNINWLSALLNKDYFLSNPKHFKNEAGLNSFYIDPQEICRSYSCQKNKSGGFDIDLTLYFAPQSHMYLGSVISGATFISIVGYLLFILGKNIYEKRS